MSARPTWMNLPWVLPRKLPISALPAIPGILERIPGGSSGGSAAAVAADECIASIGSDTGGSIRQPAALCGIVGMKPTYGRVSRFGLIAFASSLDQIGPFTKDVEDCAIMMNVLAGYDPKESTSVPAEVPDYRQFIGRDIKGWKIGIPKEYFIEGIDPEVNAAIKKAIAVIEQMRRADVWKFLCRIRNTVWRFIILSLRRKPVPIWRAMTV